MKTADSPFRFVTASYLPLIGNLKVMRHRETDWAMTAVPRLVTLMIPAGRQPTGESVWASNALPEVFSKFPVVLLASSHQT